MSPTVHASAVLVGARAVLIRGASGAGKSRLALDLIHAARAGVLPFTRLVGDDRVHLEAAGGRVLVRPAEALVGMIEVRGVGLVRMPYEPCAVVGLIVDLGTEAARMPEAHQRVADLEGVSLPRLAVAVGEPALPVLLAFLERQAACGQTG